MYIKNFIDFSSDFKKICNTFFQPAIYVFLKSNFTILLLLSYKKPAERVSYSFCDACQIHVACSHVFFSALRINEKVLYTFILKQNLSLL